MLAAPSGLVSSFPFAESWTAPLKAGAEAAMFVLLFHCPDLSITNFNGNPINLLLLVVPSQQQSEWDVG